MKSRSYISLIAVVLALFGAGTAFAAGLLIPQGQSSSLDIRDHKVNVVVEAGYVVTEVDQVFINGGGSDVEAVYSFPVPSHAAVAEFTYWIDGSPVTGEVLKKQEARDLTSRRNPRVVKPRSRIKTGIGRSTFLSTPSGRTVTSACALCICRVRIRTRESGVTFTRWRKAVSTRNAKRSGKFAMR